MCLHCAERWAVRPASAPASVSRTPTTLDDGQSAEKSGGRPVSPLYSFAHARRSDVGSSVSVNAGVLESNRGAVHRHLEGSGAVEPTGRTLLSVGRMSMSRCRLNSSCTSLGSANPAMRSRRRRSVGRGTQSQRDNAHADMGIAQHRHARTGTYRRMRSMHNAGARTHMRAHKHERE